MLLRDPTSKPWLKRLLDPSPKTLFIVSAIAFTGAIYFGWTHARFLIRGSIGTAEIVVVETPSDEYARYRLRLVDPYLPSAISVVESDRRSLTVGTRIKVFYRRDHPRSMLAIEVFAPWTRAIWLTIIGFSALGLGYREKDKSLTVTKK